MVAVPGDVILLDDSVDPQREGVVSVNGQLLNESYLPGGSTTFHDGFIGALSFCPGIITTGCQLGDSQFFVLGDNRAHSVDSRQLGPVPADLIRHRAGGHIWPVSRVF